MNVQVAGIGEVLTAGQRKVEGVVVFYSVQTSCKHAFLS